MKKFFAEFIGTFALVLFGCGAAVVAGGDVAQTAGLGLLGISLAFGLAVVVMAYAIGPITGCHINPAISIAMLVAGKLSAKDTLVYILAQVLGAIFAAFVLFVIFSGKAGCNDLGSFGSNGWGEAYMGNYNMTSAFVGEFVFTFLFLFVIFAATAKHANPAMAGLAIGLTLVLIHMVLIPVTGTSVNPARSIGPALFAGGQALSQLWLFIVAPILGGVTAAVVWKFFEPKAEVEA